MTFSGGPAARIPIAERKRRDRRRGACQEGAKHVIHRPHMSETDPETPQSAPCIAYLTGAYPAVSHTFILREVEALRRLGLDIVTCSIRRSGPEHLRGPAEKHAAETTFSCHRDRQIACRAPGRTETGAARSGALFRHARPGLADAAPGAARRPLPAVLFRRGHDPRAPPAGRGRDPYPQPFRGAVGQCRDAGRAAGQIPFSFTLHGPADLAEPVHWGLGAKIAASRFVACISNYARSQAMLVSDPAHWDRS
jgi:hypothetical protein